MGLTSQSVINSWQSLSTVDRTCHALLHHC